MKAGCGEGFWFRSDVPHSQLSSSGLGQGLRVCIPHKFPAGANAAGLATTLGGLVV